MPASDTRSEEVVELLGMGRLTHVVDIGANPIDGAPPYRPLMDAKLCRVTGFEPQSAALAELNLKKGPNEVYLDCALGDGEEHTLNVCAYSGWTSTLIPRQAALEAFEHFKINARIVGQTRVRTQRLDDIAAIQKIDFLKIDIQGGELSVFVHGREKLKNAVVIQTEVPFVNLYEGQPSFWEIDRELRAQGFIPHAFAELKKWPISPIQNGESPTKPLNQLLEADLVYVRDFTNAEAISNEQLKHLCLIAHACYNSFDLAKRCIAILEQRKCLSAGSLERYVQILRGDKKSAPQPMLSPSDVEAQFIRANELHRSGRFTEAAQGYRAVLEVNAMHFDATHLLGVVSLQQGQYVEAERQIRAAIRLNPEVAAAYSNLGNALQGLRRFEEAEILYNKAITLKPDYAEAFSNCGNALQALKRFEEAVAKYDRAITIAPKYAEAFNNRGNALQALRRYDEALTSYDRAIALKPDYPEAFNNRGNALKRLGRIAEALTSYDKAIALKPDYPDVWNNKGNALQILQRFDEALASYERAIVLRPDYDDAFNNRGIALNALKRSQEALASFDKAIALKPDHADAFNNRGIAFKDLERLDEAMEDYNKAIALRAGFVEAFNNRGNLFLKRGRYEGAFADFDQAYSLNPDMRFVEGCRLHAKMHMCDWKDIDSEMARLSQHVRQGKLATEPFMLLPTPASAEDLLRCAEIYTADKYPPYEKPVWKGERYGHDRIRVAYMSGEFRAQATAYLTADLFECHDKRKFETYALSSGSNDHSAMRKRLESAFDVFADVSLKSDAEIAAFIRKSEIDILVNLNGYFGLDRTGVFAMRPCPVQVNYLGFPGSMGAVYMDYIIADKHVIPDDQRANYSEHPAYLPDCYQPNDRKRVTSDRKFTRSMCGLPEDEIVFCCFNNNHKILPKMFDIWMRILSHVEGSVLWLLEGNAAVKHNLAREAEKRGISPHRIVFAPFMAIADHLARESLADLFLDTLPHNAHTTASDSLWCGVPVVTCVGPTFAGRVASSLLHAVALPELVAASLEEYESLAIALARDRHRLAELRERLAANRAGAALFDTPRYTRNLEAIYTQMWQRHQSGKPPTSLTAG